MRGVRNAWCLRVALAGCLVWIFIGEVGVFYLYSGSWAWPEPQTKEVVRLKVLFLSDPHIQCTFSRYEPWLFRWDADRYVRSSYSLLMKTLQPQMVIVLGDIFAEGSMASEQEWKDYLQCMDATLPVPDGVQFLVVPGDNDIGGEGSDVMKAQVINRYTSQFGPMNDIIRKDEITFIKLNTVCHIRYHDLNSVESRVRLQLNEFFEQYTKNSSSQREPKAVIVLSHVPLKQLSNHNLRVQIVQALHPHYVFSGHIHQSDHQTHSYGEWDADRYVEEFTVPTCSYRNGQMYMGVGVATIGVSGTVTYAVLWLPQRYPFLFSYIIIGVFGSFIILCVALRRQMLMFVSMHSQTIYHRLKSRQLYA